MIKRLLILAFWAGTVTPAASQARERKLPPNINHTSVNNSSPYVSLDGNSLVYISDMGEDLNLTMTWSARIGVNWQDPTVMPRTVNNHLNFLRGFSLSADGKTLFITNMRSNGLGGFDIYSSQKNGNNWSEPVNLMLPINSKSHDGCPSLSADGSLFFFMRCDKMDFKSADGCRLFYSRRKPNGDWGEPQEMPPTINTGNSQTPRIMGDGETLLFASNRMKAGKGGMDIYMTKLTNGQWSNPVPLDFINTAGDDQYVSATSAGRYLMRDVKGVHTQELSEVIFPNDVRPKGTMKIEGVVRGLTEKEGAYITLFNLEDNKPVSSTRPAFDGQFAIYAREGARYDLSVDPEKDNFTFFSRVFDLTTDKFPLLEKVDVQLAPAASGDEIQLEGVSFRQRGNELTASSSQELRRVTRLIQGNPEQSFSVQVTFNGLKKDSLQNDPDLTEVHTDTLRFLITYKTDTVVTTRDSIYVKRTYHNDRTLRQAQSVVNYLVSQGVSARKLAASGVAKVAEGEETKTMVKLVIH